jgi:hypothetical protein
MAHELINRSNTQGPVKVWKALITQTGTNAPTATVLENTTGETFTFNYVGVGVYDIISSGIFNEDKTIHYHGDPTGTPGQVQATKLMFIKSVTQLRINTFSDFASTAANALLTKTPVVILIYP